MSCQPKCTLPKTVECCIQECPKEPECNPCNKSSLGYSWGWLGSLIIWFIVFMVLFWLIYFSLKPSLVLQSNGTDVDTSKVLLAAVISSLIIVIIIWLIKVAISKR